MNDLRRRIKALADDARTKAGAGRRRGSRTVNVAGRANVVVAGNVGEEGAWHGVSSAQTDEIRQDGERR